MVKTPIQRSHVQNYRLAPRSTQSFVLPRSIKWLPGISGNLVVKSKLPPRSGSSLEAVEPHPEKGAIKLFCPTHFDHPLNFKVTYSLPLPSNTHINPQQFPAWHLTKQCLVYWLIARQERNIETFFFDICLFTFNKYWFIYI